MLVTRFAILLNRSAMAGYNKIIIGLFGTLLFMLIGTAGYHYLEGFSYLDAFYMTVITISTVGFGEVQTLSEAGRLFTIFLILFGFGALAFLIHAFTELIIENATSRNLGRKTMQKKLLQLDNHVIICGYGRVGEATAEYFNSAGINFLIIESSPDKIKELETLGYLFLEGDATREQTLRGAFIKKASSLLAMLDSDPDNLFAVLTARELNPTLQIIARTELATSEARMLRAGADSIISPHATAGRTVAEKVIILKNKMIPGKTAVARENKPYWINLDDQPDLLNHVIETAEELLHASIIGIRRENQDILMPKADENITENDKLLISDWQLEDDYEDFVKTKKIVLIDSNPATRRLYIRLFKKAGFHLLAASSGEKGMDITCREKPDGVIVDMDLPDSTGLEICKRIRDYEELDGTRIFLYTARNDQIKEKELRESGVDSVVIKSPEAGEIVKIVQQQLSKL